MDQPRIYNLFPLLAGPITGWESHLDRVARMGFNWVYLNPIQYAGFSGSLYAIKDPYDYHVALRGRIGGDASVFEAHLRAFIIAAEARGLRVMLDLVCNHTSKDALLADEHPEWYRHEKDGSLKSPSAIDPADARRVTVWGDLAELNYDEPAARDGLTAYWSRFLDHCLDLGFAGFRCDAAYKVPAETWRILIGTARQRRPDALFCGETLGCRLEEIRSVAGAGFDLLFNSSKWWDFRAPWCLEQYDAHRRLAPTISFPETHDTPRLAEEVDGRPEILRQRYLFAAAFSAAVMIPMGFEYGARKKLDVVKTRVSDREPVACDLTDFIARANAWKASTPVLNSEGPITVLSAPEEDTVRLYKRRDDAPARSQASPAGPAGTPEGSSTDRFLPADQSAPPGDAVVLWINSGPEEIAVLESWMEEAVRILAPRGERILGISSCDDERNRPGAGSAGALRPYEAVLLRAVND